MIYNDHTGVMACYENCAFSLWLFLHFFPKHNKHLSLYYVANFFELAYAKIRNRKT